MKFSSKTIHIIYLIILVSIVIPSSLTNATSEYILEITEIGHYSLSAYTYSVKVEDDIAYVTCGDLYLLNISNPANITELSSFPLYRGHKFLIENNLLYVTDEISGLKIINVTDPLNPSLVSQINDGGTVVDLCLVDNLVYVADVDDGLEIIDVSNITNPLEVNQYSEGGGVSTVQICGELLYTIVFQVDGKSWLSILDVSDTKNLIALGSYEVNLLAHDLEIENGIAYIANKDEGVIILNVTNPAEIEMIQSIELEGTSENLQIVDDLIYVANKIDGVQIFDSIDPSDPIKIGVFANGGSTQDLEIQDNLIYVADSSEGLEILEIEGLDEIRETSGYSFIVFSVAALVLVNIRRKRRKQLG